MRSTVIIGYDRTLAGGRALLEAGHEAAYRGADVTIVTAYPPFAGAGGPAGAQAAARETAVATAAFGASVLHRRYPGLAIRYEAMPGVAHEVLTTAARGADLLVLGGVLVDGPAEQPLSPVTEAALGHTPCPIMVVRAAERYPRGVVLAAIDVGHRGDEVVNFAFAEARYHSARLRAVTAFEPAALLAGVGAAGPQPKRRSGTFAEAEVTLGRILAERQARCTRVQVSGEVLDGPPATVLTAAAAHADLIVVGAHRRDGERHGVRIGAVTEALLRRATCPVIIVPHL